MKLSKKNKLINLGAFTSLLIVVYLFTIHEENKAYKAYIDSSYEGNELNLDRRLSSFYNKNQKKQSIKLIIKTLNTSPLKGYSTDNQPNAN